MMWSLARSPQDPQLKSFRILVLKDAEPAALTQGLHEYVFNYGDQPVTLMWGRGNEERLEPGDSGLCASRHHPQLCSVNDNESCPELLVVRIPGECSRTRCLWNSSTYEPRGRSRVFFEKLTLVLIMRSFSLPTVLHQGREAAAVMSRVDRRTPVCRYHQRGDGPRGRLSCVQWTPCLSPPRSSAWRFREPKDFRNPVVR